MNTLSRRVAGLLLTLFFGTSSVGTAAEAGNTNDALCVMTFNLRYASERPPNAWPQRRPVMRECILKMSPDLIGTQEGV
ncbi:MAG TPA: endonuclease, partial [Verrucomicrobiae bacterium]|nr:endonuclease [Verrucomicrobiae bacterium]